MVVEIMQLGDVVMFDREAAIQVVLDKVRKELEGYSDIRLHVTATTGNKFISDIPFVLSPPVSGPSGETSSEHHQLEQIKRILKKKYGTIVNAAKIAGVNRSQLARWLDGREQPSKRLVSQVTACLSSDSDANND